VSEGRLRAGRIGPYTLEQASVVAWDPRATEVAETVVALVRDCRPDLVVEHVGSTAIEGLPGKGVVDLATVTEPADVPAVTETLYGLGFGPQPGMDPFPATRPMLVGSMVRGGTTFRIHFHVLPDRAEFDRMLAFRDALRADPSLVRAYAELKSGIVEGGLLDGHQYTYQKQAWIADVHRRIGAARPPISPPATIGILGGGQLGRMIALAARAMGYRIAVLDPDPECPAASVADEVIVAGYDDTGGALRLAERSAVVTYELEHVALAVVDEIDTWRPVRPGRVPLLITQDRLAERRFLERVGAEVAPWREVCTPDELGDAADALGLPMRLKVTTGGYDGRGQARLVTMADVAAGFERLGRSDGTDGARGADAPPLLAERELDFVAELSVIVARGVDGRIASFPIARNRHDAGILADSVAPAPVDPAIAERARALGERLAIAMGLEGTLTAELFLLPDDRLVVNELAPRVHNSGHWTIEGAGTSQFEQHVRAICGLELGDTTARGATAVVNLLGDGSSRAARLDPGGVAAALEDPSVHLHLYDKRRVFERRKMGHVTATAATADDALAHARAAASRIHWSHGAEDGR
jgi:5-(carboxyamino)imidazole ribonucleotide synthase